MSHRYRFIFIKTFKTAGTSIEVYLSKICAELDIVTPVYPKEPLHVPRNYKGIFNPVSGISKISDVQRNLAELRLGSKFYNHIPAYKARARIPKKIWSNYFKFCVERNPWDKTLSHYFMLLNSSQHGSADNDYSIDDYLRRGQFCLNYPLYMDPRGSEIIVDRVIRYENLNPDLKDIFGQLGIEFSGQLSERAKSGYRLDKRNYREIFNNQQSELLREVFKKEIELHQYDW